MSGEDETEVFSTFEFEIHLKKGLIFCAGGIGNPNLIINLFKKHHRLVGKNLCDHSHINFSNIKIDQAKKNFRFAKYFIVNSKNNKEQNLFIKKNSYFTGVQLDYIADPSLILRRLYIRARSLISLKILLFMVKYKKLLTHFPDYEFTSFEDGIRLVYESMCNNSYKK